MKTKKEEITKEEVTDVELAKDDIRIQKSINYGSGEIELIKNMYAKNATNDELSLLMYMSNKYDLDILTKEIFLVKYSNQPAMIFTSRDGHLAVAHKVRTISNEPAFDGMESGTKIGEDKKLMGWCKIFRKDMANPFYVEVDFGEYDTGQALWKTKPKTMIQKVAESQCLRRAFHISGIYSEEEMGQWREEMKKITSNNITTGTSNKTFDWSKLDLNKKPFWGYGDKRKTPPIIKRLYAIAKRLISPKEEIEITFHSISSKEHSYDYTYGDIKKIDEYLQKLENDISVEEEQLDNEFEQSEQDKLKV